MKDQVIILVSDENYIDHVKSLAVNCVEQGEYKGDFAVICPVGSRAAAEFKSIGFYVLEVDSQGFLQKFSVFDKFFKQWKEALYLDCDILVQDKLSRLFELLKKHNLWMDTEDGTTMESFWRDPHPQEHKETYDWMNENYPAVNKQTFNSAFILFHPETISEGVPEKLMEIQNKINSVNNPAFGGTDQQTINLLLWDKIKKIPNKLVCFWGLAEPQNDEDSEYRQYKKGDIPVAIHYSRWYGPWIEKTPDADAYMLRRHNISCNDLYKQNLSKFNATFSI